MATYYFKRKRDAERRADELRASYEHVSIGEIRNEYEVCYCCPRNVALAALFRRLKATCQMACK